MGFSYQEGTTGANPFLRGVGDSAEHQQPQQRQGWGQHKTASLVLCDGMRIAAPGVKLNWFFVYLKCDRPSI